VGITLIFDRKCGILKEYQFNHKHMTEEDRQPQQYSPSEQQRIMRDLQQSKREADQDGDYIRSYYLNEIKSD
jgi:hypothetical protein